MSTLEPLSKTQVERRIAELGDWFHNMTLHGVQTAPSHFLGDYPSTKWNGFKDALPQDLSGKSVLDIGCNAGFYSIAMKARGAARVVGIDSDPDYLAQARFAAQVEQAEIEFRQMSVYDVAELGERFDLVLFMGVFYHLRHPLLALDLLYDHVVGDLLVFQSLTRGLELPEPLDEDFPFSNEEVFQRSDFPAMRFVEKCYAGDPTNWWIPNRAGSEAMLRSSGFEIQSRPEAEVYICKRTAQRQHDEMS